MRPRGFEKHQECSRVVSEVCSRLLHEVCIVDAGLLSSKEKELHVLFNSG